MSNKHTFGNNLNQIRLITTKIKTDKSKYCDSMFPTFVFILFLKKNVFKINAKGIPAAPAWYR